jgi:hypothetical protein
MMASGGLYMRLLFYGLSLEPHVPDNHLIRKIARIIRE